MRICLIRPPTITTTDAVAEDSTPPLGVAYLAGAARKMGHDVQVIDALGEALDRYTRIPELETGLLHGLEADEIVSLIREDAEVIGLACMFSLEWPFTRDLAKMIKQRFPDKLLVAGGEHITSLPEFCLRDCPAIDVCVLSEGEEILVDLLAAVEQGLDLREVGGLCLRDSDSSVRTQAAKRIRDLGTIPHPAWDLVPMDAYLDNGHRMGVDYGRSIAMLASRGCPYRCTFCSNPMIWTTLWRPRKPQDVFDEMVEYLDRYRIENFEFYDPTAIVKRSWIIEFCNLILGSGLKFNWQLPSGTRSEALDAEVCDLMKRTGCRYINYAPESGSVETLKLIKKQIKKDRMLKSMRGAVKLGLGVKANFILGFPHETLRNVLQTYGFILHNAWIGTNDISLFAFSPYPGSELFESLVAKGKITLNDDYFYSLSQYSDAKYARSYNERYSGSTLRFLCLFGMGIFYLTSFALRPMRLFHVVRYVQRRDGKTKLSAALVRVIKKREQLKRLEAVR